MWERYFLYMASFYAFKPFFTEKMQSDKKYKHHIIDPYIELKYMKFI